MNKSQFQITYMSLPRTNKNHIKIRNKIISACGVSSAIFYNWLKGLTQVPPLAQKEISKILNKSQCELFPIEENEYSFNN